MYSLLPPSRWILVPVSWLVLTSGLWEFRCFAQTAGLAQISGVIQDTSGAAITGAQVKITQIETKLERQTTSDDQGRYVAPALPVGPYQIEVSANGFQTYLQSGIVLQVGQEVTVNVSMKVGATSETVKVTAVANQVETSSNTISQVIDERRIVDLPLDGRQPTQLILLSGASVSTPTNGGNILGSKSFYSSVEISTAGGQGNGVNYMLDGADNNDAFSNVNLPLPFPDALQEFSVQTSTLPARWGLHSAAVVNAVTQSGTNDWHGDLFEFLRNGDVNARNFFAPAHDSLKRNQFGGTFGDRIIRDKLFIFGGFQGTQNRSNPPQSVSFVPTAAVLNGDFSVIDGPQCTTSGKAITLINPYTGAQFPNDQIPVSLFNPASLALAKGLPAAQTPCGRVTYGIPTTGDEDQGIVRMDWLLSSKHTIYGRYFVDDYRNPAIPSANALTTTNPGNLERAQSATLGDTYTFSPTVVNSAHLTFTRRVDDRGAAPNAINLDSKNLGINDGTIGPNYLEATVSGYFSVGCSTCKPAFFNVNAFSFADDVDIVRGKHQIAFGVNFFHNQFNSVIDQVALDTFTGQYATGESIGDALAAYVLGAPSSSNQQNVTQNYTRQSVLGLYVQDNIRLTSRLSINIGVRWDPAAVPYDLYNHGNSFSQANFNAGIASSVFTNAPPGLLFYGDRGIPRGFQNGDMKLFSPRLGIAWDPTGSGKQSIRIAGGILRDTESLYNNNELAVNAPYSVNVTATFPFQEGGSFSNPWTGYPGGDPFPVPSPLPPNYKFPSGVTYAFFPLQDRPLYMGQWNVSYQRQITSTWLLSATYLGNKTTHIEVPQAGNPAVFIPGSSASTNSRRVLYLQNPTYGASYGQVVTVDDGGNANYNGLLLSIQHRFNHGLTWPTNYTWSHCLSETDSYVAPGMQPGFEQPNNLRADYGNCIFDARQVMNTSVVALSPVAGHGLAGRIFGQWQIAPLVLHALWPAREHHRWRGHFGDWLWLFVGPAQFRFGS